MRKFKASFFVMKKYLFFLLLTAVVACHPSAEHVPVPAADKSKKQWDLIVIKAGQLTTSINLPGEMKAWEMVQIFPKVNGFARDVLVDRGSAVKKGQLLVRLEAPEMEQQYLAAKSKYLQAYTVFVSDKDRYNRLVATAKTAGTVAVYDIESAKAKMVADSAIAEGEQANCRAIDAIKNYLTVTAPFDGVITERNVHPGALVGPGLKTDERAMLVLEQEDKLRLVVSIPEVYTSQIGRNTAVIFRTGAVPGQEFKGRISRSSGSLNLRFRSETVEIDVDNKGHLFKPGMFAEISLPARRPTAAMVVPRSAVVTSTERKYVIVVVDGKTKWVDVQEGNVQDDSVEIFGSVAAGDRVIQHATDEIKEGVVVDGGL
jgi:RND family efflux transporter MFP subunit